MKQQLLSMVACFLILTATHAQEKKEKNEKPPVAAAEAFKKAYPGASKVKWEKEGADYEVNFLQGKKEMSAVYAPAGTLIEAEEGMEPSQLPAAITTYVKAHYKGAKIKEAAKITRANGEIQYEAEVNGSDLIFDKDGKFIKAEKEKEKD